MVGRIHLITGTDAARIAERSRALVSELAGDNPDVFALDVIQEGDEVAPPAALGLLVQAVLTPPFLGGAKTVWLKNFSAFKEEKKAGTSGPLGVAFDRLVGVLEKGLGDDIALVMSGSDVDKRHRLYKLCEKTGRVELLDKPDMKQKNWQAEMGRVLRESAEAKGLKLSPPAVEHLISVIGTETAAVDSQLEKLRCYLGDGQTVTGDVAQLMCQGDGETVFWALGDAVGKRNLIRALGEIDTVLSLEKSPDGAVLGLVWQLSGLFRQMLQAKILLAVMKVGVPQLSRRLQDLSDEHKVEYALRGLEIVGMHPYRCQMLAEQAENYTGDELIDAVTGIRDVHWHCVTSGGDKRIALESMLARVCARPRR